MKALIIKPLSFLFFLPAFLLVAACSQAPAKTRTTVVTVEGMTCEACVNAITQKLSNLPGVSSIEVSLENKTATILHDAATAPAERLIEQIELIGYTVPSEVENPETSPIPGT